MNDPLQDRELMDAFLAERSESAFRSLVNRHVDLVFATALRQVGDRCLAQEIAQNVFIALAQKAPALRGRETLAGWLHRATLLEAKSRIRTELRRRRREAMAATMVPIETEGSSPVAALIPILDEGLMSLRESDRLAVVLRFLEQRPLREVGRELGIEEDAARKRVTRALDRLSAFFQRRGFIVSVETTLVSIVAETANAAPPGLALASAQGALATGSSALSLNHFLLQLMNLSNTKSAVVLGTILIAAPLTWQQITHSRLEAHQADADERLASAQEDLAQLRQQIDLNRDTFLETQAAAFNANLQSPPPSARTAPPNVAPYQWDDQSPFARIPKAFLSRMNVSAVTGKTGQLSDRIKTVLQLTDEESRRVQGAMARFLSRYYATLAVGMKQIEPREEHLQNRTPEQTRVFDMPDISPQIGQLREKLFAGLEAEIGSERFEIFKRGLRNWMPVDDRTRGISTMMAVCDFAHEIVVHRPEPGSSQIPWTVRRDNIGMVSSTIPVEEIPSIYRSPLKDWIELARAPVAEQATAR